MLKIFEELMLTAILALGCCLLATLLRANKQRILTYTAHLIQKAEKTVQGSKMGADKKALVTAQLEAAGIRVNSWLSAQIDTIVATLNSKGAWLAEQVKQETAAMSETNTAAGSGSNG